MLEQLKSSTPLDYEPGFSRDLEITIINKQRCAILSETKEEYLLARVDDNLRFTSFPFWVIKALNSSNANVEKSSGFGIAPKDASLSALLYPCNTFGPAFN